MGQKVNPIGFRVGVIRKWDANWFADKNYTDLLHEDLKIRDYVEEKHEKSGVSRVEIERAASRVKVTIHTAKPGMVIGKGGSGVDELRNELEKLTDKKIHINVVEIKKPEMDAKLVANSIAIALSRRVAFRRAMKQAVGRAMRAGAKGVKVMCSGRLGGADMSRTEWYTEGTVPLHTLRADIDYGMVEAHTTYGRIGVKCWIYKGDVIPELDEKKDKKSEEKEGGR